MATVERAMMLKTMRKHGVTLALFVLVIFFVFNKLIKEEDVEY